ncbi:hypothetical protein IGI04_002573 [Brassica rapa subsp. trilocularis]|uniref:RRM domain-containing protein n=4 Tax=Brassica TaxID=3705 RepID=M4EMD0_BRACM|nr:hypothetical protein IGI04_002573 [Brassica rapa subsp. trilocularis]CAF2151651.1 unnamed protein product [Brassica napus]CDY61849.1 BnaAnng17810D [Brassica napus]
MAVPENAGVKVDSSGDNNNTASPAAETKPSCLDDQSPIETAGKGRNPNGEREKSGGCLKNLADAFSKLNPMAKEFVPPPYLAQSGVLRNGFAVQPVLADGNDHLPTRRRSFGQGKRRMNKRTSLAQKEDVIRRTVYVSHIDQLVTEENLAGVFAFCGQVVDCRVCGYPNSLLRFAFVEFTNEEGARAALSMSGTVLGFYPLKVLPSKTAIAPVNPTFLPRSEDERAMCMRTVYCTNIDKRISQTDLKGFFEMFCGEVHRLRLGDYHHHSRISFVEFSNAESAIRALNCSGIFLGALPIRVSPSKTPVRPHYPLAESK